MASCPREFCLSNSQFLEGSASYEVEADKERCEKSYFLRSIVCIKYCYSADRDN